MTDDEVPLLTSLRGKGVVADDDAGPDGLALVLRHDPDGDPRIIAGGDRSLVGKGPHPHLLLLRLQLDYLSCHSVRCATGQLASTEFVDGYGASMGISRSSSVVDTGHPAH